MLPVYALVQPLFEPAHERLRPRPRPVRAAAYGIGFAAVRDLERRAFGAGGPGSEKVVDADFEEVDDQKKRGSA